MFDYVEPCGSPLLSALKPGNQAGCGYSIPKRGEIFNPDAMFFFVYERSPEREHIY